MIAPSELMVLMNFAFLILCHTISSDQILQTNQNMHGLALHYICKS